jgi:hypothetical protein
LLVCLARLSSVASRDIYGLESEGQTRVLAGHRAKLDGGCGRPVHRSLINLET